MGLSIADKGQTDLFYLENLVLVALEAVQFELQVPEVPQGHSLVGGAGGEDELGVRVETQTVDLQTDGVSSISPELTTATYLGGVSIHSVGWSVGHGRPGVPDHQLLVVSHGAEQRLVQEMPGNVLHHSGVT